MKKSNFNDQSTMDIFTTKKYIPILDSNIRIRTSKIMSILQAK